MTTERLSVLVTRPRGQAGALLEQLRSAGFHPLHLPLLALRELAPIPPQQRQWVLDLDQYQHVIFISANAVRYGLDLIDEYWPQLPMGLNWYAIGGTTASLLAARGLQVIEPGVEMSSEGLLAVPALQQVAGSKVLIVKGVGGRDTLRRALLARGARVDELACYQRSCPAYPAGELAALLSRERVQTVLISSGEGLQNMLTLLSAEESTKFRDIRLVVPSPRVEQLAREAGFTQLTRSANASDEAMLAALQQRESGEH